jgi:hypothetical protein
MPSSSYKQLSQEADDLADKFNKAELTSKARGKGIRVLSKWTKFDIALAILEKEQGIETIQSHRRERAGKEKYRHTTDGVISIFNDRENGWNRRINDDYRGGGMRISQSWAGPLGEGKDKVDLVYTVKPKYAAEARDKMKKREFGPWSSLYAKDPEEARDSGTGLLRFFEEMVTGKGNNRGCSSIDMGGFGGRRRLE